MISPLAKSVFPSLNYLRSIQANQIFVFEPKMKSFFRIPTNLFIRTWQCDIAAKSCFYLLTSIFSVKCELFKVKCLLCLQLNCYRFGMKIMSTTYIPSTSMLCEGRSSIILELPLQFSSLPDSEGDWQDALSFTINIIPYTSRPLTLCTRIAILDDRHSRFLWIVLTLSPVSNQFCCLYECPFSERNCLENTRYGES